MDKPNPTCGTVNRHNACKHHVAIDFLLHKKAKATIPTLRLSFYFTLFALNLMKKKIISYSGGHTGPGIFFPQFFML